MYRLDKTKVGEEIKKIKLLDTKGSEIRTGNFEPSKVELKAGAYFSVYAGGDVIGDIKRCSVTYDGLANDAKVGDTILKEGFLPKDEIVLYKTLSKFRNDTAHVYKKPPFKVLLQFYKENRDFLINIIENINGVIKRG